MVVIIPALSRSARWAVICPCLSELYVTPAQSAESRWGGTSLRILMMYWEDSANFLPPTASTAGSQVLGTQAHQWWGVEESRNKFGNLGFRKVGGLGWVGRLGWVLALFFFGGSRAWTQGLHLEAVHQSYFCDEFFEIGSGELFAWGWLRTAILLISASWVARITGVSHWCLAGPWLCSLKNERSSETQALS
jgi:hypothetical protein